MNGTQTLNLNSAECIKEVMNLGSQTYQNICSGASTVLPWGFGGWLLFVVCCFVALPFVLLPFAFGVGLMLKAAGVLED